MLPHDSQPTPVLCTAHALVQDEAEMLHEDAGMCLFWLLPSPSVSQPAPRDAEPLPPASNCQGSQMLSAEPVPNAASRGRWHWLLEAALLWMLQRLYRCCWQALGLTPFLDTQGGKRCFYEGIPQHGQSG